MFAHFARMVQVYHILLLIWHFLSIKFWIYLGQIVLSGFAAGDEHLKLTTTMFKNIFPDIDINTVSSFDSFFSISKLASLLSFSFFFFYFPWSRLNIVLTWMSQVKLSSCQRIVLLNYNKDTKLIDFRHYSIRLQPVGVSRRIRKFVQNHQVPDLRNLQDVSDFVTKWVSFHMSYIYL